MPKKRKSTDYSEKASANTIEYLKTATAIINLNLGGLEVRMVGCCEVAIFGLMAHVISLGIYAGYNIKLKEKQLQLEKQNQELKREIQAVERVNGKEKADLAELQAKVKELER